jgi:hypothetical protein
MTPPKATDEFPKDVQTHAHTGTAGPARASNTSDTQHDNHEDLVTRKYNPYNVKRWLGQKPKDEPWSDIRNTEDNDRPAK